MLVHALVATIGTGPEPAIFAVFNGIDEILAHLIRGGFWVPMLA